MMMYLMGSVNAMGGFQLWFWSGHVEYWAAEQGYNTHNVFSFVALSLVH